MKKTLVPLTFALALLLTACGGGSGSTEPSPSPEQSTAASETEAFTEPSEDALGAAIPMPAGEFKLLAISGAEIDFTLPTPSSDPLVADIEKFRKDIGAPPVSYLVADIDNRAGSEYVNMYSVSAFDADGNKYEFSGASDVIGEWGPTYTEDYDYVLPDGTKLEEAKGEALNARSTDLYNEYLDGIDVAERGKMVLISEDAKMPDEFMRVAVQPSGGMAEGEEAFSPSQGGTD